MSKEYTVQITTQYRGSEVVWIMADSKSDAIKQIRRKAWLEGWFNREDGKVTYKTVDQFIG